LDSTLDPPFLTAAEVGALLRLKKSRVYELAAADLLPTVRLGRRVLFSRRGMLAMDQAAIDRTMERAA
jgi:excisionase family DNA binding protein